MKSLQVIYSGNLRTSAEHLETGSIINTDAPKDNQGLGEAFSPTDLLCTSLISCILTIMAISVKKHDTDIKGTKASIQKVMRSQPRMISHINATIIFPKNYSDKIKRILEKSIHNCPVHRSLSNEIIKDIKLVYK